MPPLLTKRNLLNLGLAALVAVLALVAWLEPGKTPPPEAENLTDLAASRVHKIRIERREGKTVELERIEGTWQLHEPVTAPANPFRVESLLRVTEYKSLGHNPVDKLELGAFGLDKPAVRLFLDDDTEIDFGGSTPLDNRRYVRIGDTVHLIKDAAYYYLIGTWTMFLSPRLLPEGAPIERLELPALTLQSRDGNWQPEPRPAAYSADDGAKLLDAWRLAQAIEVRPHTASADSDGEVEQARVYLRGQEEPVVFQILARSPDLVLLRPDLGAAFHLPAEQAAALLTLPTVPAAGATATPPGKP